MTVRPIEERDIPTCTRIYNRYITETTVSFEEKPLTEEQFGNRVKTISSSYPYLVAEADGKTVGYAYLTPYGERSAYRYTADLSIYLDWDCRGKGIGASLYREIELAARKRGLYSLIALVTGENASSLAFHTRQGFVWVGEIPDAGYKMNRWISIILLQKML